MRYINSLTLVISISILGAGGTASADIFEGDWAFLKCTAHKSIEFSLADKKRDWGLLKTWDVEKKEKIRSFMLQRKNDPQMLYSPDYDAWFKCGAPDYLTYCSGSLREFRQPIQMNMYKDGRGYIFWPEAQTVDFFWCHTKCHGNGPC
tara:strand:- start:7795 stop:8238 length:444 start_codon:yes stop_codon:yes gene_type:complete